MQNGTVGYIVEYEISAIVFLLVIMSRYFGARRFPNQRNSLFSLILWVSLADLTLDVISSIIIDNVLSVPLAVTYIVNATFYFLQILLPLLMTAYTLAMVEYIDKKKLRRLLPLLLPGLVILLMLLTNFMTHWFFYVDPVKGHVRGSLFISTYAVCLFYMCATFLIAFRNRSKLRRTEYMTVFRFLAIVLVAMAIQFFYPALLISGVSIALSVTMMYFTIQNLETMVDSTTKAFTYEAMTAFLYDRMQEKSMVQLVAVKIHNMPRINELLGIENGSLLLRQVGEFLKSASTDIWAFRMRGGYFVAITRKREDYHLLCEQLEKRVPQPWRVGGTDIMLSATICRVDTSELLSEPLSPEDAISYLDNAFMQNERVGGKGRIITIEAKLFDKLKRRRAVEAALREAIESGDGLELYYQPLWSVKQKRFTGAEALLRFKHPGMGFIPPDEFVPIAESNGLVTAMDELVVRKACEFIRDTDSFQGLGIDTVEVNLSALEFMHRRLPDLLNGIIAEYKVDPKLLCFEITETAATESFFLQKDCMGELSKSGCRFALDDFGTGYANISQVIQLPFSMVKLDKSLLFGPELVVEYMVSMFARLGRKTVIEGVETQEQAALAKKINVDYIQGYYYARPMNRKDFLLFLRAAQSREQ